MVTDWQSIVAPRKRSLSGNHPPLRADKCLRHARRHFGWIVLGAAVVLANRGILAALQAVAIAMNPPCAASISPRNAFVLDHHELGGPKLDSQYGDGLPLPRHFNTNTAGNSGDNMGDNSRVGNSDVSDNSRNHNTGNVYISGNNRIRSNRNLACNRLCCVSGPLQFEYLPRSRQVLPMMVAT